MKSKFTYDDVVRFSSDAVLRRKAWVVGIFESEKESGVYWKKFPPGVIYTLEFEDGSSVEAHENELVAWDE